MSGSYLGLGVVVKTPLRAAILLSVAVVLTITAIWESVSHTYGRRQQHFVMSQAQLDRADAIAERLSHQMIEQQMRQYDQKHGISPSP